MATKAAFNKPPTTLLTIPTELRLQIYDYILPPEPPGLFAYMYRSPGRASRYGPAVKGPHMKLFWVCRQIRDEIIDEAFHGKVFVLEASLYAQDFGGLTTIPAGCFPIFWVTHIRKLVLFMALDFLRPKRMGDLWILQQMTGLEELWLNFKVDFLEILAQDELTNEAHPVKALLDCIPKTCTLRIGASESEQAALIRDLGGSLRYIFDGTFCAVGIGSIEKEMEELSVTKGIFSGSALDHSKCGLPSQPECCDAKACVNTCLEMKKRLRKEEQDGD